MFNEYENVLNVQYMLFHNFLFTIEAFHMCYCNLNFASEVCIHLFQVCLPYCATFVHRTQKTRFLLLNENMTLQSLKKARGSQGSKHS